MRSARGERSDLPEAADGHSLEPSDFLTARSFATAAAWARGWGRALGRVGGEPMKTAVTFVQALGLKSLSDWQAYCRGERDRLAGETEGYTHKSIVGVWRRVSRARCIGGSGLNAKRRVGWRSYRDAVIFVHALRIKGPLGELVRLLSRRAGGLAGKTRRYTA